MGKKVGLSIITLVVVVCLCLSVMGVLAAGVVVWSGGRAACPSWRCQPCRHRDPATPVPLPPAVTLAPRVTALPACRGLDVDPHRQPCAGCHPHPCSGRTNRHKPASRYHPADGYDQQQVMSLRGLKPIKMSCAAC